MALDHGVLVVSRRDRRGKPALVARAAGLKMIASCADGREAVQAILSEEPDLVFLDVQMPELSGLDVLEAVGPDRMPPVIFVTAYDRCALAAFEHAAVDYLLKPFDDERFLRAVERVREQSQLRKLEGLRDQLLQLLERSGASAGREPFLRRIAVRDRDAIRIVEVKDIEYIRASGPYVELNVGDRSLLHRERMQRLESMLDPADFCRVHRSAIVNLGEVVALEPGVGGDYLVRLRRGISVKVSRARLAELQSRLGIR